MTSLCHGTTAVLRICFVNKQETVTEKKESNMFELSFNFSLKSKIRILSKHLKGHEIKQLNTIKQ